MGDEPVIWRPVRGRLVVRMPYVRGNRWWLKDALGERIRPEWDRRELRWKVARPHLRPLLEALVNRWGQVRVILDYSSLERCDSRCQTAVGEECTCSCLGAHHGGAGYVQRWQQVGDTLLVSSDTWRVQRVVSAADLR